MGDYLKNGTKIGTCGRGYYATLEMLKKHKGDPEADAYMDPKNGCSFAFPFPEYDLKSVGEISNFHKGDMVEYVVSLPADQFETYHERMSHHLHPKGLPGFNVFFPCPYEAGSEVSTNFNKNEVKFYLKEQIYFDGKLAVLVECVCCGRRNVLELKESIYIAEQIKAQSDRYKAQADNCSLTSECNELLEKAVYHSTIANRILETYQD